MRRLNSYKPGFTLLEIMLVVAILAILAVISRDFFGSFSTGAQMEASASTIAFDLRNARDKAMNGLEDRNWGIRFVNGLNDSYEIFSSPSDYNDAAKMTSAVSYLPGGVSFQAPTEGVNAEVLFTKISGTTTPISIILKTGPNIRPIIISGQGLVN